jgi:hypothetical protein
MTEAIARTGNENTFAELHMRRIGGEMVEIRTILIDYSPWSGRYITDEIALEVVEEEYAIDEAVEQECAARDRLEAMKALGWRDIGFGEAVERIIYSGFRAIPVAAE